MGNDAKFGKSGLRVDDFSVRIGPVFATNGDLDTPESRERALRKEQDERVAQHDGGEPTGEASEAAAEEAVDASIEDARARADRGHDEGEMPILLRDPVTGRVIPSP